ncbi:MAG: hypothetical protein IKI30_03485 [Oxalobacter sp.]|nr:hypothetical protein [Oxalobacter sp.]
MMRTPTFLKALLAGCLALSCVSVQAEPVVDDEKLIDQAVQDFWQHMEKGETGMSGAIVKIADCYDSPSTNKLYCLYYDYTARMVDADVRRMLGIEGTLDFFSDDVFSERAAKHVYLPNGSTLVEANDHLELLSYKIQDRLDKLVK